MIQIEPDFSHGVLKVYEDWEKGRITEAIEKKSVKK